MGKLNDKTKYLRDILLTNKSKLSNGSPYNSKTPSQFNKTFTTMPNINTKTNDFRNTQNLFNPRSPFEKDLRYKQN